MSFVPRSITLEGRFRVAQAPDRAFPLFSPRGEEAWVPDWKPELLFPAGAEWETGLVFRTVHKGQESVWFVGHLDRRALDVRYHRVDVGLTATTIEVSSRPAGDGTEVHVRYTFVGLTDDGNAFVGERTQGEFAEKMLDWEKSIARVTVA